MTEKISRVIVEASIVFVSIFTTLSLLFSAVSNDFKLIYFYLGYMLYFSLPFIFACFFGIISMITEKVNRNLAKIIEQFQIAFFLTGLMTVIWLATSAAQTYVFPTVYISYMPYFSIPLLESIVFTFFSIALITPHLPETQINLPTIHNAWITNLTNSLKSFRISRIIRSSRAKVFLTGFLALY